MEPESDSDNSDYEYVTTYEPTFQVPEPENVNIEEMQKAELCRGHPIRQYLVKDVVPTLKQALKELDKTRPENPIKFLGEYLLNHKSN